MTSRFRTWSHRFFFTCFIAILLLYLLSCLIPLLHAGRFWFIAMLGLGFPLTLVFLFISLIVWIVKRKKKWIIVSAVALLAGWPLINATIGFHFFQSKFEVAKPATTLRVLCWNVSRWDEHNRQQKGGVTYRQLMLDAVYAQNADILCLQEFFEPYDDPLYQSNLDALKKMGYPYTYFFPSSVIVTGHYKFGLAIASKYPIADTMQFSFGQTPHSEGLIYADIKVKNRIVRVFSTHLESARLSNDGYFGNNDGGSLNKARSIVGRMRSAYQYRTVQAELVRDEIKRSPYPVIMAGNLGDVPASYTYAMVKNSRRLQDVFLKRGAGLGRTFRFFSPTLRLDYIMADPGFKVLQYARPALIYSDHYPLVADLQFKEGQ